jgi:hypothetical protein
MLKLRPVGLVVPLAGRQGPVMAKDISQYENGCLRAFDTLMR